MHDPLKSLVEESDLAPLAAPMRAVQLVAQVRRLHGRRQRRRRVFTAAAAILVGVLSWQGAVRLADHGASKSIPVAGRKSEATTENLPQLAAQIDREQQIVDRLLDAERRDRVTTATKKRSPMLARRTQVEEQIGRASMALLFAADEVRSRPALRPSAELDYQFVIARFPGTEWADKAKQRLADLKD